MKFLEDQPPSNKVFAHIGGVKNKDLNALELQFLIDIKFSLKVDDEIYQEYEEKLLLGQENRQEE